MKHQKFRNCVAYARRLGELEVENVAMELKIHRLARDNNRVVKKLHNLEEKHKDVLVELDMKTANFEKLHKAYSNVCNANMAQGRETDNLRKSACQNAKRERELKARVQQTYRLA